MHDDAKKYVCGKCGAAFKDPSNRKRHAAKCGLVKNTLPFVIHSITFPKLFFRTICIWYFLFNIFNCMIFNCVNFALLEFQSQGFVRRRNKADEEKVRHEKALQEYKRWKYSKMSRFLLSLNVGIAMLINLFSLGSRDARRNDAWGWDHPLKVTPVHIFQMGPLKPFYDMMLFVNTSIK